MSNVVAVMHEGRIVQMGTPREIYERPANGFVTDFIGSTNLVPGRVVGPVGGELYRVETACGPLTCAIPGGESTGREVIVSIRPEDVSIDERGRPEGAWEAVVEQVVFLGECVDCRLSAGAFPMRVRAHPSVRVRRGDRVFLAFHAERCIAIRPEGAPAPSDPPLPVGGDRYTQL